RATTQHGGHAGNTGGIAAKIEDHSGGASGGFDNQGGDRAIGERYPYRTASGGNNHPATSRWHFARLPENSEGIAELGGITRKNSVGHGYFRAASAAGRA